MNTTSRPRDVLLGPDLELALVRRFEDAVAAIRVDDTSSPGGSLARLRAQQEFERNWRIATHMRGHIR